MNSFKWLQRSVLAAAVTAAGVAGAAETQAPAGSRNVVPNVSLSCPSGSVQAGGFYSPMEATMCVKKGTREYHGPYVHQWANGKTRATGQYLNGARTGTWVFFNEDGSKEMEVSFRDGDYDGRRVEYHANGRIKLEETWVAGKRQGLVRAFDAMGDVVEVKEFRDNRIVATR